MWDQLRTLAGSEGLMPHGMCYLWQPDLLWLHVISDVVTGIAYFAIPPALLYLVVKARKELPPDTSYGARRLPYDWMIVAFGAFIVACGATHFLAAWTVWRPDYWVEGGVKGVTALASLATAIALPPLIPRMLGIVRDARESEARRVRLEEAHDELAEMHERLKEYDRLKSDFFARVSHELRTPLSLIVGPVERIREREGVDPETAEELDVVARNARTLRSRVDDLLDMAKLEAGGVRPEPATVELAALHRRIAAHYRSLASERSIDIRVETPPALTARLDPEQWEKIAMNLLSNAFKFTPEEGVVRTTLEAVGAPGTADGRVVLEVADSGPGIPRELRPTIFDRFGQADEGDDRRFGGTGLGLSIVAELVRLHDGEVEVDDAPEGGALFRVSVPWEDRDGDPVVPGEGTGDDAPEPEATETVRELPERAETHPVSSGFDAASGAGDEDAVPGAVANGGRILVVEDHPDMARHLGRLLTDAGHAVAYARDGREGIEAVRASRPELIVTDIMMPRMTGEELVRELRESEEEGEELPVIVLTAKAGDEIAGDVLRAGAQDYLVKPVSAEELRARVANHLQLARSRAILREALESREADVAVLTEALTGRKEELERTLEEKAVLLQELHHRVKGNLQTVSSLLSLQLRRLADPGAKEVLEESRSRIAAMSLLHEKLYGSRDPARVEIDEYARSLVDNIFRFHGTPRDRVSLRVAVDDFSLDIDRGIACGLILHELVTNALRHAFPGKEEGTLAVELHEVGSTVELVVEDDGVGFPEELDPTRPETLGLELIASLTRRLDGEVRVERDDGTRFRIVFPRDGEGE